MVPSADHSMQQKGSKGEGGDHVCLVFCLFFYVFFFVPLVC